ncbi:hypothetical protein [Streptomyces adelaidensis]|uniref:hypothetical protein n=1 Tax=Streptomyces adelaidensis TaxID=2796465 RepID=UPI00190448F9|nr:hypothetical protein [Streptomyces adelaidensis]
MDVEPSLERADGHGAARVASLEELRDPGRTDESIDTIEKNLDDIADIADIAERTGGDDNKVDKAVDDLSRAIEDYDQSILDGDTDTDPDSSGIDAAADELKDVRTS